MPGAPGIGGMPDIPPAFVRHILHSASPIATLTTGRKMPILRKMHAQQMAKRPNWNLGPFRHPGRGRQAKRPAAAHREHRHPKAQFRALGRTFRKTSRMHLLRSLPPWHLTSNVTCIHLFPV